MGNALVEGYLAERDDLLNTVTVFRNAAADQHRDPTEPEIDATKKAYERIDKLDELIAVVGVDKTMDQATRDKLTQPPPSGNSTAKYRTAGDMVWDCMHANFGTQHSTEDQEAKRRWDAVMKRAAQHMGTDADLTVATAGDVGGLYVAPVVGPVIDIYPKAQPFLTAIGKRPAPNALNFLRPRLVDPDLAANTGVGVQSAEKAELVSKKFDIKTDPVTLSTIGGYLNVSQQLMSLQPAGWNIIINELQRRVANAGELAAIDVVNNTTDNVPLADDADSDVVIAALYDAAALVYANTGELPTWLAYGPLGWAALGKLCDSAKRPLFPFLSPSNAMGTGDLGSFTQAGPLGLQQIITPAITNDMFFMGNDLGLEVYSYPFPILEAIEPSVFGRQVAVAEALAFYAPITNETGPERNGAVSIGS